MTRLISLIFLSALTAASASAQTVYVAHSFFSPLPFPPIRAAGNLIEASDGNFYGTTLSGATAEPGCDCGMVYQVRPDGVLTDIHDFINGADGAVPTSIIEAGDGSLYGTATGGGLSGGCPGRGGCGTLFKLGLDGQFEVLHSFTGGLDSSSPSSIILASDGNIYGIATGFATSGGGAIFRLNPSNNRFKTIYSFGPGDGVSYAPNPSSILEGSDGNLYGATSQPPDGSGGSLASCCGTIFRLRADGEYTTLYSFSGARDGAGPYSLVEAGDGDLYGVTSTAINSDYFAGGEGSIFKISLAGAFSVVYSFNFMTTDVNETGVLPDSLYIGSNGYIYGTTEQGGTFGGEFGNGTLFALAEDGTPSTQYVFPASLEFGETPSQLAQAHDGRFYAVTATTVDVQISPKLPPPVQVSLTQTSIPGGTTAHAAVRITNAFSASAQQCYGFASSGAEPTALGRIALQPSGTAFTGEFNFTPPTAGSWLLAATCGGVESGLANLTVKAN